MNSSVTGKGESVCVYLSVCLSLCLFVRLSVYGCLSCSINNWGGSIADSKTSWSFEYVCLCLFFSIYVFLCVFFSVPFFLFVISLSVSSVFFSSRLRLSISLSLYVFELYLSVDLSRLMPVCFWQTFWIRHNWEMLIICLIKVNNRLGGNNAQVRHSLYSSWNSKQNMSAEPNLRLSITILYKTTSVNRV